MSICHLKCWARCGRGKDGFRPIYLETKSKVQKKDAFSCITVSARTRTSNISASEETSSANSKSVNTSFPTVTPVIPRLGWQKTLSKPPFWTHFADASKIFWPLLRDLRMVKFGPDRLRFAGVISERLIFRAPKVISTYSHIHSALLLVLCS